MRALEISHPDIHTEFMSGRFAVQQQEHHRFAMTPCDQVIEQTFNRDSKTKGGMTGITLNKAAAHRWVLSYLEQAKIASACYSLAGENLNLCTGTQPELNKPRMMKDEQAVQNVMSTIEGFTNPFCDEGDIQLWNISCGTIAPPMV